jgi:hypothetical protein
MKLAAFVIVAALLTRCSSANPETRPDQPLRLHFGETAAVAGSSTGVTFADVSDSRCPATVSCIWAGDAAVRLDEQNGESVTLHTNSSAGPQSARLGGLVITLERVEPEPAEKALSKNDYVVTLRTSR